jgi:hypothetical protein
MPWYRFREFAETMEARNRMAQFIAWPFGCINPEKR